MPHGDDKTQEVESRLMDTEKEQVWVMAVIAALSIGLMIGIFSRPEEPNLLHEVLLRTDLPQGCKKEIQSVIRDLQMEDELRHENFPKP